MSNIVLISCKQSYRENIEANYTHYQSVEESMGEVLDNTTCTFEVLREDMRKIYLDIEKIQDDNIIHNLINNFMKFLKITNKDSYVLTENKGSEQHSGLSYHLILPYKMMVSDMVKLVVSFTVEHPEYSKYVDVGVYDKRRLFRLPNNGKMSSKGINMNDIHKVVHGEFKDAYIQVIDKVPQLPVDELKAHIDKVTDTTIREAKRKCYENGMSRQYNSMSKRINNIEKMLTMILDKLSIKDEH